MLMIDVASKIKCYDMNDNTIIVEVVEVVEVIVLVAVGVGVAVVVGENMTVFWSSQSSR